MRDAQLGSPTVRSHGMMVATHTVRSHGIEVARTHLNDWLILKLLLAIVVLLNAIHPFYWFVGKDMMDDLKYPLKSNTVLIWAVTVYAVLMPMVSAHLFSTKTCLCSSSCHVRDFVLCSGNSCYHRCYKRCSWTS